MARCAYGVQTIVLPREGFTKRSAIAWAKRHGYDVSYVDVKPSSYRIRQKGPRSFRRLRAKKLPNGVTLILGFC